MPQFSYDHPVAINGQIASMSPATVDSYENPLLAQVSTVTVGGTTDGVYTVQIDGPEGSFQVSFTASGNTAAGSPLMTLGSPRQTVWPPSTTAFRIWMFLKATPSPWRWRIRKSPAR